MPICIFNPIESNSTPTCFSSSQYTAGGIDLAARALGSDVYSPHGCAISI